MEFHSWICPSYKPIPVPSRSPAGRVPSFTESENATATEMPLSIREAR